MIIDAEAYLAHYGILRKSGRYPWGSGETQSARNASFMETVDRMKKQEGMSDPDIAKGFGMTTTELRALRSIASNQQKQEKIDKAVKLKDKGWSNMAIAKEMGINESSVRSLISASQKEKADNLQTISGMLKRQVDEKKFIDVGAGVENQLGISSTKLNTAIAMLKEEGYTQYSVQVDQLGTANKTTVKVLAPPGTTYRDIVAAKGDICQISEFSDDGGRSFLGQHPPLSVDPKRVQVVYKEQGGDQADGVIYVRPGVEDVSIGNSRYAQVRIKVGDKHYLKGMAVYKDDLPDGVDLQFNTNKSDTGDKLKAMKGLKDDPDNPFGSIVRQKLAIGPDGKERVTSAMNIVGMKDGSGEEGGWDQWSNSLSRQLLSKQKPDLIEQQLGVAYQRKKEELDEIMGLTNPTVRKELLEKFADGADSSAVHMKAAALPRQATQVILPVNTLKPTEIYAPNFKNGERVALVRYPHGGTFEIPELTVNNNHPPAKKLIGRAADAVGINAKVAERLSGADFDGDTVVVIPNNNGQITSTPALKGLKNFDVQQYKMADDAPPVTARTKGMQMSLVSNLITDMTINGATPDELARAVRHSMVVIDSEKHHLDYKKSAIDNGIRQLYTKYQNKPQGGASTLISRATAQARVEDRKLRRAQDGGPIDPATGKLQYADKAESYVDRNGKTVIKYRKSQKLAETDDAYTLVADPNNKVEKLYADHSNRMKDIANQARKEVAVYKPPLVSKSAKAAYKKEVDSLNAKLNQARRNKPLERQAQIFANATVEQKKAAKPDMDPAELKKIKSQALAEARVRTGAARFLIRPTPEEWAAIQAGAVSANQLNQILKSADIDTIRELATPRTRILMDPAHTARARQMAANGFTQAEIADQLGVSLTTLKDAL